MSSVKSRPTFISIENLPDTPLQGTLVLDAGQLQHVVERLDITALRDLSCAWEIGHAEIKGGIEAHLTVQATIEQHCIISLQPMHQQINETLTTIFLPPARLAEVEAEASLDDQMVFEELTGDSIDLVELLIQSLALVVAPFPRLPDAALPLELQQTGIIQQDNTPRKTPFKELADVLKK